MQILGPNANSSTTYSDLIAFEQFLSDPATSIPLDSNFLVLFSQRGMPQGIKTYTDSALGGYEPGRWGIEIDNKKLIDSLESSYDYRCFFANGVTLPSESIGQKRVGMQDIYGDQSGGLLSGVVTTSREQRGPLSLTLLETNASFIDLVIRPWILAVSHYGLYGRLESSAYCVKTNIIVLQFDHRSKTINKIRKKFTFFGCAPTNFVPLTVTYGKADTSIINVEWVYNHYTLESAGVANR